MKRTTAVPKPSNAEARSSLAYSVPEAARALSIGTTKLNELIASGELPSFSIGRRRLVAWSDLESFVKARRHAASRRI